jgi:hypothetical protein
MTTERLFAQNALQLSNSPTCASELQTRIIAPVLYPAWASRSSCSFFPVGACGTTGRFTAPAAPAVVDAGIPHAVGTRVVVQPNADERES